MPFQNLNGVFPFQEEILGHVITVCLQSEGDVNRWYSGQPLPSVRDCPGVITRDFCHKDTINFIAKPCVYSYARWSIGHLQASASIYSSHPVVLGTARVPQVHEAGAYCFSMLYWLVVWNILYFPIYWECHHPNWRILFSGVQTTNQMKTLKNSELFAERSIFSDIFSTEQCDVISDVVFRPPIPCETGAGFKTRSCQPVGRNLVPRCYSLARGSAELRFF